MLAKIATGIVIFIASCVMAVMLLVFHTGVVFVELEQKRPEGHHIYLPIPVILAHAAVALIPESEMRDAKMELAPHREMILALCDEIGRCPDGPLVEVRNNEEQLHLLKKGQYLMMALESREEKVKLRVPVGSVRNLVRQVAN